MAKICVVTGGGSGMGLETAKIVGKDQKIIITGRTAAKLQNAVDELSALGIEAEAYSCDVSDLNSVKKLAEYAASQGSIKTVIHAAGITNGQGNANMIFSINAVGTVYVNTVFEELMEDGGCILNVSSMAGHMLPEANVPYSLFELALTDVDAFAKAGAEMFPPINQKDAEVGAYTTSKKFVIWYTTRLALKAGKRGIRVVSISPGTFLTPMGIHAGEEAAQCAKIGALGRVGDPVEIAKMMAFMVSDECSYLTGTDVLYDGGVIAAMNAMAAAQNT